VGGLKIAFKGQNPSRPVISAGVPGRQGLSRKGMTKAERTVTNTYRIAKIKE
jgi:hypothetical protein